MKETFCEAGLYKESDEVGCRPCVSGTYSGNRAVGNHSCLDCDAGRAKSLLMFVFVLTGFDSGKYGTGAGKDISGCFACQAGKYNKVKGSTECTFCPKGKYQSSVGQEGCEPCVAGLC